MKRDGQSACGAVLGGMVVFLLLLVSHLPAQGRVYIDITAPHLRQIPTAVPVFKRLAPETDGDVSAVAFSDLLAETIDFTGYFKILDRESFLEDPQEASLFQHAINFKNWTDVGTELLVKGAFRVDDGLLKMELRLFDTFGHRLIVGKRYTGHLKDGRRMIRRFCSDIIRILTGHEGIFDTRIAFVSSSTGTKEIYIADFDGADPKRFTNTGAITLFPAWSSDGKWLAYTDYRKGKPDLYIRHVKEPQGTVVSVEGSSITPAWIPGQFALAASLSHKGNPSIYMLTGKGKIMKRITHHWDIDVSPTWAPEGDAVAFVSNRSGSPQIYIQDMTSGKTRRLTFQGNYNTAPQWSPRGTHIVYSGMVAGEGTDIYVIPVAGGDPIRLTHGAANNESPSWSPDGSLIAFCSDREGPQRIYVMNANGANQRRLLAMKGNQTSPAWSPRLSGH